MLENKNKECLNVGQQWMETTYRIDLQNRANMPWKSRMTRNSYPRRANVHDRECGQVRKK